MASQDYAFGLVVVEVGVFSQLVDGGAVDSDFMDFGCVDAELAGELVEAVGGHAVDFEELIATDETTETIPVACYALCKGGTDGT